MNLSSVYITLYVQEKVLPTNPRSEFQRDGGPQRLREVLDCDGAEYRARRGAQQPQPSGNTDVHHAY